MSDEVKGTPKDQNTAPSQEEHEAHEEHKRIFRDFIAKAKDLIPKDWGCAVFLVSPAGCTHSVYDDEMPGMILQHLGNQMLKDFMAAKVSEAALLKLLQGRTKSPKTEKKKDVN